MVDAHPGADTVLGDTFSAVHWAEIEALRRRRAWVHATTERPEGAGDADVAETGNASGILRTWNTVGLSLSGGGIRSATFGLGVLQALDKHRLINQFDYLSTVSGGGYIGTALTATLQQSRGTFVFGHDVIADTDAVGHLRNYSNYLLPRNHSAFRNAADAVAVVGRGLATNAVILAGFILALAVVTTLAFPARSTLHASFLPQLIDGLLLQHLHAPYHGFVSRFVGWLCGGGVDRHRFALTKLCLVVVLVTQVAWAWHRSTRDRRGTDVSGPFLTVVRVMIAVTAVVAFLDLQPVAIDIAIHAGKWWVSGPVKFVTTYVLAPAGIIATVATFLSGQIASFIKSTEASGSRRVIAARLIGQAVILIAAIFVPLMLEGAYLWLCVALIKGPVAVAFAAAFAAVVLLAIAWRFDPNANSLHRFYRDRLSKAFHFEQVRKAENDQEDGSLGHLVARTRLARTPSQMRAARRVPVWARPNASLTDPAPDEVLALRDPIALEDLDTPFAPYHLINATLNLQGSLHANMRGRGSDFFVFTPKHFGGPLLRYHPVEESGVDLATAMAISGAAASSAMGSLTMFKVLAPTLAVLNIRLGYWLKNPARLVDATTSRWMKLRRAAKGKAYLLAEILGLLDERSEQIYLTDGGHIENLGLYELLRRGCKAIVVIDAEADPAITCAALIKAERYARIDFGVRIDIAAEKLAAANGAIDAAIDAGSPLPEAAGPHAAIGRILYPNGTNGVLLYVKAALSGDEADYVLRYKKQYPAFPHENTGDQFFSEDQFECYRALGFHAVDRLFDGSDAVASREDGHAAAQLWAELRQALLHTT